MRRLLLESKGPCLKIHDHDSLSNGTTKGNLLMNVNSGAVSSQSPPQAILQWSERVWVVVIGVLLLNSVLRGIRAPNMWAYTQFLLNYDFGFAKRSFQGAVIGAFNITGTYSFAFWYMIAVFTANVLLLLWVMRRLCATEDLTARLIATLFASSLAVVALAHFVGYGDQPALLVTLLALLIRNFYYRCVLVAVLFPVCLLIQETEFVLFFPVVAFRFLIDLGGAATMHRRRLAALCLVLVCVLAALLAVGNAHMSETLATAMMESIQSKAEYPLRHGQTEPLIKTFTEFLGVFIRAYWESSLMRRFLFLSCIVTLPSMVYLMRRTWSLMTCNEYSIFLRIVAIGASMAPLSLIVIAGDLNRFAALAVLTSFIAYAIVRLQGGIADSAVAASKSHVLLPLALIAMNLSSSIPLFDGYVVRNFPYEELINDLRNTLILKEPFPPRPEQCTVTPPYDCTFIHRALRPPQSGISLSNASKPQPSAGSEAAAAAD